MVFHPRQLTITWTALTPFAGSFWTTITWRIAIVPLSHYHWLENPSGRVGLTSPTITTNGITITSFGIPSGCVSTLLPSGWGSTSPHNVENAICCSGVSVWFLELFNLQKKLSIQHARYSIFGSTRFGEPEHKNKMLCKSVLQEFQLAAAQLLRQINAQNLRWRRTEL